MVEHADGARVEEVRTEGSGARLPAALPKRYRVSRKGPARNLRLPPAGPRKNNRPYHRLSDDKLEASLARDLATLAKGDEAYATWRAEVSKRVDAKRAALAERKAAAAAQQAEREDIETAIDRALADIPEEKQRQIKKAFARAAKKRAGGRTLSSSKPARESSSP